MNAKIEECKLRKAKEDFELQKQMELDKQEKLKWAAKTKDNFEDCVNAMKNCIARRLILGLFKAKEDNNMSAIQKK